MRLLVPLLAVLLAACSEPSPGERLLTRAVEAIGGEGRLGEIRTLTVEGDGEAFEPGQRRDLDGAPPRLDVSRYVWTVRLDDHQWREEQIRTPRYPTETPAPRRVVRALDGDVAFDVELGGGAVRQSTEVMRRRRVESLQHPVVLLRRLVDGELVVQGGPDASASTVIVSGNDGQTMELTIDPATGLPAAISATVADVVAGDVTIQVAFEGYEDVDGLKLPTRILTRVDGVETLRVQVRSHDVNGEARDLSAGDELRSGADVSMVAVQELGEGIWLLAGGSHHSVLARLDDDLVLIEAPLDERRARALLDEAGRLVPDRPITHLVVTHHHDDHIGGVRYAVAQGIPVIASARMAPVLQALTTRPHRVMPDALEENPSALELTGVEGELALGAGGRRLVLREVGENEHASSLLTVYLPAERLLIQADLFRAPGVEHLGPPHLPFLSTLLSHVRNGGLDVDRVVPLHGRVVRFDELLTLERWQSGALPIP